MKVKYENDRLQLLPEDTFEERFATELQRLIYTVSNNLMAWYGDVNFDEQETSGYVITWKPEKDPKKIGIGEVKNVYS